MGQACATPWRNSAWSGATRQAAWRRGVTIVAAGRPRLHRPRRARVRAVACLPDLGRERPAPPAPGRDGALPRRWGRARGRSCLCSRARSPSSAPSGSARGTAIVFAALRLGNGWYHGLRATMTFLPADLFAIPAWWVLLLGVALLVRRARARPPRRPPPRSAAASPPPSAAGRRTEPRESPDSPGTPISRLQLFCSDPGDGRYCQSGDWRSRVVPIGRLVFPGLAPIPDSDVRSPAGD